MGRRAKGWCRIGNFTARLESPLKIEIVESLGYSFLRHVKRCWLVQVNWKASEHWSKQVPDAELDEKFAEMKRRFDPEGGVFKKTGNAAQFLRQGEIDVLGVDQDGGVHAMEAAFHEGGLHYEGGVANRVLKKLLRTLMILAAYHSPETKLRIYFVSPKVNPSVQGPLEDTFRMLRTKYPEIEWILAINQDFRDKVLTPTLEKAGTVADTSELFMRSAKLLDLSRDSSGMGGHIDPAGIQKPGPEPLQPLVRGLMRTLLEDHPDLLDDADRGGLMDPYHCKSSLGLQIGNLALLRRTEAGREISGHGRYWKKPYGGKFYVCSQWWKDHHAANAEKLLQLVSRLVQRKSYHPEVSALEKHERALRAYVDRANT